MTQESTQDDTQEPGGSFTTVGTTRKADTTALVTNGTESFPDDSFATLYSVGGNQNSAPAIIEPTFKPATLQALVTQNNTLAQCVEVMEVNIDGTGHTIELVEGAKDNEKELQILKNFFDEPYPGKSMISLRRDLREDLESTGVGYIEVVRTIAREVIFLNNLGSNDMRLVRYDDPVLVDRTVTRGGREVTVKVRTRERRFVQLVNGKKTYFKEFGASRDLDRDSGLWAPAGQKLSAQKVASEVLYFTVNKEPKSPYGVPRWINQLPSVLGSRKAEEFNLDFFDSGGLPPVLVLVQGGFLGTAVKDSLVAHLSGKSSKHRAAVVEAQSSSGALDSAGSVKITLERFGAERQQDSMFQGYDKATAEHVRAAFRLPPLFMGLAQDYNFATALTGYMTAEAQVFGPERTEFDERMWWIVKALGVRSYTFKSKPMTLTDVQTQIKAMELVLTNKIVDPEDAVRALNTLTGQNLKYQKAPDPVVPQVSQQFDAAGNPLNTPGSAQAAAKPPTPKQKPGDDPVGAGHDTSTGKNTTKEPVKARKGDETRDSYIVKLACQWASALGLSDQTVTDVPDITVLKEEVSALVGDDQKLFNDVLATKSLVGVEQDFEGLAELCGCAVHIH